MGTDLLRKICGPRLLPETTARVHLVIECLEVGTLLFVAAVGSDEEAVLDVGGNNEVHAMPRNTPHFLPVALALLTLADFGRGQVCALGVRPTTYKTNFDQTPNVRATDITKRIADGFTAVCAPKCPTVAIFSNTTARNALVFASPSSMKIVYSPTFFSAVSAQYGDDGLIGLVAHEYGHIIDSVAIGSWMNVAWTPELRADAWAGCALAKLKFKSLGLERALTAIARHPAEAKSAWASHISPLRTGYSQCGGSTRDFDSSAATLGSSAK
jgi:hypothetical protein